MASEVFLFVLVGATVNIRYLGNVGFKALIVIVAALIMRMLGVSVFWEQIYLEKKSFLQ